MKINTNAERAGFFKARLAISACSSFPVTRPVAVPSAMRGPDLRACTPSCQLEGTHIWPHGGSSAMKGLDPLACQSRSSTHILLALYIGR
eukprot:1137346-Pelagomonas_calceolata.AAC.5